MSQVPYSLPYLKLKFCNHFLAPPCVLCVQFIPFNVNTELLTNIAQKYVEDRGCKN
jgi:hypothetical protein